MRAALFLLLILSPALARCAALDSTALSAFHLPGVPDTLCSKVEHGIPLTLDDVATLSRAGVSRASIIDYLYTFGGRFNLDPATASQLQSQGVPADLIDYMQSPPAHTSHFAF